MSIEDEIRRIVNEELDRRLKDDNLRQLVAEGKISNNDARKQMGYRALPTPEGTDARSILDGEWVDNSVAIPEPFEWSRRHDRTTGWYHICDVSGGVPVDIFLPIGAECSDCGAYLTNGGGVKKRELW